MVVVDGKSDSRVHLLRMNSLGHIFSMMDALPVVREPVESGELIIISSIQKQGRVRRRS